MDSAQEKEEEEPPRSFPPYQKVEKQSPPQPMIAVSRYTSVEDMLENLEIDGISLTDAQYQTVIGAMAPGNEKHQLLRQKDGETR